MQSLEQITKQVENLSKLEKELLVKNLLEKMDHKDIIKLLQEKINDADIMATLKMIEPVFRDWDNEEDSIYDNL